ncbi:hypothetical protein PF003_g3053 [Phytophthora fragariae]|nr:hypothetical protein PF003_g3053 [Phytophthora fragariae]
MQFQSLGMFELAPTPYLLSQSSDVSIVDIWSPSPSLDPSVTLLGSPSPSLVSVKTPTSRTGSASPTHTSPLSSQASRRIRSPRTPDGEVPPWFAEAFESDGYDSEALDLIRHLSLDALSTRSLAPEAPNAARQQPLVKEMLAQELVVQELAREPTEEMVEKLTQKLGAGGHHAGVGGEPDTGAGGAGDGWWGTWCRFWLWA